MNNVSSSRMEYGSSFAKAIYWVNLLVSDLEPAHIVKDCLWEYGCKHHVKKEEDKPFPKEEPFIELFSQPHPPIRNLTMSGKESIKEGKLNLDSIWQSEQPVMFGFVDRRTSMTKVEISFNEDEFLLATEIKQMVTTLIE